MASSMGRILPGADEGSITLVRSKHTGFLYESPFVWRDATWAQGEGVPGFLLCSPDRVTELLELYGDMVPQTPGENSVVGGAIQ